MYGRYRDMFVCSLVDGHLGHFCFLAIRKKSCSEHSWVSFGAREFICVGLPRSRVAKAECRHIASCSKFSWFSKVVLQVSSSQQLMLHSISVPWYWHLTVPFFFLSRFYASGRPSQEAGGGWCDSRSPWKTFQEKIVSSIPLLQRKSPKIAEWVGHHIQRRINWIVFILEPKYVLYLW